MLKNDTLKNGTSRIGLYGSVPLGGFHIVVMIVSTVENMFLVLFQAVLIHVNTLITRSQA